MRPPTDPILGIVPADPSLRRFALVAWGSLVIIGAIAIWHVTSVLRDAQAMAVYDPRGAFLAVQNIVVAVVIAGVVLSVIVALYCLVNALRIIRGTGQITERVDHDPLDTALANASEHLDNDAVDFELDRRCVH